MRFAVFLLVLMFTMSPAWSAPTCQTREGMTARCGTPDAMPLGWRVAAADRHVPPDNVRDLWNVVGGIMLLFALIALLPPFDGSRSQDWGDEER